MKKFKKYMMAFCAFAISLSVLGGCAKTDTSEKKPAGDSEATGLKIAIVSSPSGVDDGSFNQEIYGGILSFIEKHPESTVQTIREETGDSAAAIKAVEDIVADYDVIVACGFQFSGIGTVAQDNPEKKFILVDTPPVDETFSPLTLDNVYGMTFAEQESGFFAGVAAALETKTNKVAVVNGIPYPSNVNYQYGFQAGVEYANKHFDTKVECVSLPSNAGLIKKEIDGEEKEVNIAGNYVGSFADEASGKTVGKALIDAGVDVIFVAAGGSGNGVFTAVKEAADVKVIGCDVDQYSDGQSGDTNIMLTSALKVMGINVDKQLNLVLEGKFEGKNELLTAKENSTGFVSAEGRHQLSAETLEKLAQVNELMQKGEIVPPGNFSESTYDSFPGL